MDFRKVLILLFFSSTIFSQKKYTLEVVGEPVNSFELKRNLTQIVFAKTKGFMLDTYKQAVTLKLSKKDREKLNIKEIKLIDIDNTHFYGKPFRKKLKVIQISDNVFYTEKLEKRISKKFKNLFLTDTIIPNDIHKYSNNAKDWIDLLDKDKEVTLIKQGCVETNTPRSSSYVYFEHTKISDLARKQLYKVVRLFPEEISKKWSKNEWLNWFENKVKF